LERETKREISFPEPEPGEDLKDMYEMRGFFENFE